MHEQARALDVREELVAETRALAGALDQTGDVGEHELTLIVVEHAEVGLERREGVGGDLRRGAREARQQRGLAGVGQPHEANIREQLQAQLQPALLPRQPPLGEARGLARGGGKALVAPPARATAGDDDALTVAQEFPAAPLQILLLAGGLSARGHPDRERLPIGAVAQRPFAVAPARGAMVGLAPEALQIAQRVGANQHHVAPTTPIAPIGAPARHVRLAAKARAAVAPGSGLDVDACAVVQHRGPS